MPRTQHDWLAAKKTNKGKSMQIEEAVVWCGQCRCKLEDTRQYKTTEKMIWLLQLIVSIGLCLSVCRSLYHDFCLVLFGFVHLWRTRGMPKTRFSRLCATRVRDFSNGMRSSFHEDTAVAAVAAGSAPPPPPAGLPSLSLADAVELDVSDPM